MIRKTVLATAAALTLTTVAMAQDKTDKNEPVITPLTIGDAARPIDISDWVKGSKVEKFETGKVYVVEFWATWCGPCRQSMPHLTKMQEDYKDYNVTFISISDEERKVVDEFLAKTDKASGKTWSEIIGYTLTTDPDMSVKNDYLRAADQPGIPCAFIVGKDSKIEWIGNPHPKANEGFDEALEAVVKDKWDRTEFKAKWEKEQAVEREAMKAQKELSTAMRAKDWDTVVKLLDAQIAADPKAINPKITKFTLMVGPMDQPAKAYAFGEEVAKDNWDNGMLLNQLAWYVVDNPGVKTRDMDFAMKLANRAVEVTESKDGAILDTLAHVYAAKGDFASAVKYEKLAIENAPDEAMKAELQKALETFEAKSKG
jgi:thiol-disulfide isomerase/thioredoxin